MPKVLALRSCWRSRSFWRSSCSRVMACKTARLPPMKFGCDVFSHASSTAIRFETISRPATRPFSKSTATVSTTFVWRVGNLARSELSAQCTAILCISARTASTVSSAGRSSRPICFFTSAWNDTSGTKSECWWPLALLIAMQISASEVVSKGSTCRSVRQKRSSKIYVTRAPPVISSRRSKSVSLPLADRCAEARPPVKSPLTPQPEPNRPRNAPLLGPPELAEASAKIPLLVAEVAPPVARGASPLTEPVKRLA
mmetsp:Transcript_41413/g.93322  ORF Transcript_41413/g.93322 Transcript_41413/m.93322 type:complete len:256 (-) Transcript_41413:664-1431(-)